MPWLCLINNSNKHFVCTDIVRIDNNRLPQRVETLEPHKLVLCRACGEKTRHCRTAYSIQLKLFFDTSIKNFMRLSDLTSAPSILTAVPSVWKPFPPEMYRLVIVKLQPTTCENVFKLALSRPFDLIGRFNAFVNKSVMPGRVSVQFPGRVSVGHKKRKLISP